MIDLLKFYRVRDWIKNLGLCFIGFVAAQAVSPNHSVHSLIALASVVFYLGLGYAVAFSVNNFYDFQFQKEENYAKYLVGHMGKAYCLGLTAVPFLLMSVVYLKSGYPPFHLIFLATIVYILYSIPPFRLKRHFILSIPINAFYIGSISIVAGYLTVTDRLSQDALALAAIFTFYPAFAEIVHQMADVRSDKKAGIKSMPAVFGIAKTVRIAANAQLMLATAITTMVIAGFIHPVYLGAALFSLLRFLKISGTSESEDSKTLTNQLFGTYEGAYFLFATAVRALIR